MYPLFQFLSLLLLIQLKPSVKISILLTFIFLKLTLSPPSSKTSLKKTLSPQHASTPHPLFVITIELLLMMTSFPPPFLTQLPRLRILSSIDNWTLIPGAASSNASTFALPASTIISASPSSTTKSCSSPLLRFRRCPLVSTHPIQLPLLLRPYHWCHWMRLPRLLIFNNIQQFDNWPANFNVESPKRPRLPPSKAGLVTKWIVHSALYKRKLFEYQDFLKT